MHSIEIYDEYMIRCGYEDNVNMPSFYPCLSSHKTNPVFHFVHNREEAIKNYSFLKENSSTSLVPA